MFEDEEKLLSHIKKEQETDEPIKEEKDASDCDIGGDQSHSAGEVCDDLNNKYSCSKGPYSTDNKDHLKPLLTQAGERPFQCELCDKAFTLKKPLTWNYLIQRPYVCDTCGKGFPYKSNLRRHELSFKGKCHLSRLEDCNKKPDQKSCCTQCNDLKQHQLTHTGERPSKNTPLPRFQCTLCPFFADRKAKLDTHLRIHTGERPFQCELCNKTFTQYAHLKAHGLVHTGEQPYACDTCGRRFSRRANLQLHVSLHSEERPYVCDTCGKGFRRKSSLRRHELISKGKSQGLPPKA